MGTCDWLDRALNWKSNDLGFNVHCWLCQCVKLTFYWHWIRRELTITTPFFFFFYLFLFIYFCRLDWQTSVSFSFLWIKFPPFLLNLCVLSTQFQTFAHSEVTYSFDVLDLLDLASWGGHLPTDYPGILACDLLSLISVVGILGVQRPMCFIIAQFKKCILLVMYRYVIHLKLLYNNHYPIV